MGIYRRSSRGVGEMIQVGMTLTLEDTASIDRAVYKCKVADLENGYVYISYPINEATDKTVFLVNQTNLRITFLGRDNNVYAFNSSVIGRAVRNIPVIKLVLPESLKRVQRRQFVRVPVSLSVQFFSTKNEFLPFQTKMLDISAGGFAALLKDQVNLQKHHQIIVSFDIPDREGRILTLTLPATIIRISAKTDREPARVSLLFANILSEDRENIIRYVFKRQLELKNKGIT